MDSGHSDVLAAALVKLHPLALLVWRKKSCRLTPVLLCTKLRLVRVIGRGVFTTKLNALVTYRSLTFVRDFSDTLSRVFAV